MQSSLDLPIWSSWPDRLPTRPLCADVFADGAYRLPRTAALSCRHIEFNTASRLAWMNFDVDQRDSFEVWDRANLPPPNAYVQNPSNGHGHLLYAIRTPIGLTGLSRERPIALAADVQRGMTRRFGADPAYANRFAKNPLSPRWRSGWFASKPYDLVFLLDALDRHDLRPVSKSSEAAGLGRNVDVFNAVRGFAYRNVLAAKKVTNLEGWTTKLFVEAQIVNRQFVNPLSLAELRQISKSVAKWTWKNFNEHKFSQLQSKRRAIGAAKQRRSTSSKIEALLRGVS